MSDTAAEQVTDADVIQRVRALHRQTFVIGAERECMEGECEHPVCMAGGEAPEKEFPVCAHCMSLADDTGVTDEWYPGWCVYPCATIAALDFPGLTPSEVRERFRSAETSE